MSRGAGCGERGRLRGVGVIHACLVQQQRLHGFNGTCPDREPERRTPGFVFELHVGARVQQLSDEIRILQLRREHQRIQPPGILRIEVGASSYQGTYDRRMRRLGGGEDRGFRFSLTLIRGRAPCKQESDDVLTARANGEHQR